MIMTFFSFFLFFFYLFLTLWIFFSHFPMDVAHGRPYLLSVQRKGSRCTLTQSQWADWILKKSRSIHSSITHNNRHRDTFTGRPRPRGDHWELRDPSDWPHFPSLTQLFSAFFPVVDLSWTGTMGGGGWKETFLPFMQQTTATLYCRTRIS